ncbi:hypothetical protein LXA43DRAFT_1090934 [Ganoderma leucocontextum]|nr:hypothetical protein LXA43DRAFT_1090934 [Ganoderma leucocontextum]
MFHDPRPPNPKRPRDAPAGVEASQDSVDGLKRSEEFWIQDGNIVLVAGETAFRVYRGLLALQSMIRLTDSPQDLAHLLRVLLPTSRIFLYPSKGDPPLSLNKISAIIRLTHIYHVEDLLRQALSVLQDSFTSSFKAWEDESRVLPMDTNGADPIAAVNLARLTDTSLVLPLALYTCCEAGPIIIDGWEREDGTIECLSSADLKRCIGAREELAREAFSLVSVIFNPDPSEKCTTRDACNTALRRTLASVLRLDSVATPSVLDTWGPIIQGNARPQNEVGYCSACKRDLLARDVRERKRIWNGLPKMFDVEVPNWNQDLVEEGQDDDNADENAGN